MQISITIPSIDLQRKLFQFTNEHDRPFTVTAGIHSPVSEPVIAGRSWWKEATWKEKKKGNFIYKALGVKADQYYCQSTCFTEYFIPLWLPTNTITDWFVCNPTKESHLDLALPPSHASWDMMCHVFHVTNDKATTNPIFAVVFTQPPLRPRKPGRSTEGKVKVKKFGGGHRTSSGLWKPPLTPLASTTDGGWYAKHSWMGRTCCETIKDSALEILYLEDLRKLCSFYSNSHSSTKLKPVTNQEV